MWRRDRYQKDVKHYYVETATGFTFEEGWDESFEQRYSGNANASTAIMRGVDGPGPSLDTWEALEDEGEDEDSATESGGSEDDEQEEDDASNAGKSQRSVKRPRREAAKEEMYEEELCRYMLHVRFRCWPL